MQLSEKLLSLLEIGLTLWFIPLGFFFFFLVIIIVWYWCFWTVVLAKTLESPLDCKKIQAVHPKGNQSWIFIRTEYLYWIFLNSPEYSCWSWNSDTLATWYKELTHWKRPWCWERLKAGGERDDRGWDGWMASPTQWTWVWVNFRSWWWTRRPGVLQSMGSQRVGHNWVTELNWI